MTDKIVRSLIEQARYISFDIFDTAVLRIVREPADLFDLVERWYRDSIGQLSFHFKAVR